TSPATRESASFARSTSRGATSPSDETARWNPASAGISPPGCLDRTIEPSRSARSPYSRRRAAATLVSLLVTTHSAASEPPTPQRTPAPPSVAFDRPFRHPGLRSHGQDARQQHGSASDQGPLAPPSRSPSRRLPGRRPPKACPSLDAGTALPRGGGRR